VECAPNRPGTLVRVRSRKVTPGNYGEERPLIFLGNQANNNPVECKCMRGLGLWQRRKGLLRIQNRADVTRSNKNSRLQRCSVRLSHQSEARTAMIAGRRPTPTSVPSNVSFGSLGSVVSDNALGFSKVGVQGQVGHTPDNGSYLRMFVCKGHHPPQIHRRFIAHCYS
jgi:hypothetical protein